MVKLVLGKISRANGSTSKVFFFFFCKIPFKYDFFFFFIFFQKRPSRYYFREAAKDHRKSICIPSLLVCRLSLKEKEERKVGWEGIKKEGKRKWENPISK